VAAVIEQRTWAIMLLRLHEEVPHYPGILVGNSDARFMESPPLQEGSDPGAPWGIFTVNGADDCSSLHRLFFMTFSVLFS